MNPLPINKAYHLLQQIERQNLIINSQSVEMSAFYSARNPSQCADKFTSGSQKKDFRDSKKTKSNMFCDFCKMKGHLKEQCLKIVG